MDVNKIFGLFGGQEENPKPDFDHENDMSYLLEDFKNHPLFWVGMFKKLIHNHRTFSKKVIGFFSRMDEDSPSSSSSMSTIAPPSGVFVIPSIKRPYSGSIGISGMIVPFKLLLLMLD
jgi:hypothetical protein